MLLDAGLPPDLPPELWNTEAPDVVERIHRAYVTAGAQIITTNTFGASRMKLSSFRMQHRLAEFISGAVKIAKKVGGNIAIAGDIGPLGVFMQPIGEMSFDEAYAEFSEIARYFDCAGVDFLLLETFTDLMEMKAALLACKDASELPIFVTFAFDEGDRSVTGTPPDVFAAVADALPCDAVGTNCGNGLESVGNAIRRMRPITEKPLIGQPNAGKPSMQNGRTIFPVTPEQMADFAIDLWQSGANFIGGCCGSTPSHIARIADAVRGKPVVNTRKSMSFYAASRTKLLQISSEKPTVIIGERINPSGRRKLRESLERGDIGAAKLEAIKQEIADALDICVASPKVDELAVLPRVVSGVSSIVEQPLFIDTTNPAALELALKVYPGLPVINSISGKSSDIETFLPIALRWGAGFIALCMDDAGVAESEERCIEIAGKIIEKASDFGISKNRILIDPMMMPVSVVPQRIRIILSILKTLFSTFHIPTVIGLSNVSYGLPVRSIINASMLAAAIESGLCAVIADPTDERIVDTVFASAFLIGKDIRGENFMKKYSVAQAIQEQEHTSSLRDDIIHGNLDGLAEHVEAELQNCASSMKSSYQH